MIDALDHMIRSFIVSKRLNDQKFPVVLTIRNVKVKTVFGPLEN